MDPRVHALELRVQGVLIGLLRTYYIKAPKGKKVTEQVNCPVSLTPFRRLLITSSPQCCASTPPKEPAPERKHAEHI